MTRTGSAALGLMLLLAGPSAALAESSGGQQPFELVRSLSTLQDEIAKGSTDAHVAHRQRMAAVAGQLEAVDPRAWQEPRNVRAAILFVLSGGDPRVLRSLVGLRGIPADTVTLMQGALAYAEGRSDDAAEHLSKVEARSLDPGIAGTVALVQSALVARADPGKAIALLDVARLLSPGTLVEEVALRRQMLLLPEAGRWDRLEPLLSRYIRRFGKSVYSGAFWRQLAAGVASSDLVSDPPRQAHFEAIVRHLDSESRQHLYLSLAREGIIRGRIGLTRFAAGSAVTLTGTGSTEGLRAQVYEAAALIVTDRYDHGLSRLMGIAREKLAAPDAELLDAALAVARQIRRPPNPSAGAEAQTSALAGRTRELSAIGQRVVERARTALAAVDTLLSGGAR